MKSIIKKVRNKLDNQYYKFAKYYNKASVADYKVEKLGNDYSFCMVPESTLDQNSIIYSFGAGEDLSSDIQMIKKYGCNVIIFDPIPRAVVHFEQLTQSVKKNKPYLNHSGEKYNLLKSEISKIQFEKIALWQENSTLKLFLPENPDDDCSCSINDVQNTNEYIEVEAMKLSTIMKKMGHQHIDYLKLDIEGAEFEVLENIIQEGINIKTIYLEFHYRNVSRPLSNVRDIRNALNSLLNNHFSIIDNYVNKYFTLMKTAKNNLR